MYEYACLWSDTNFNGTRLAQSQCGTITLGSLFNSSVGSIHNNQTTGTQTLLLNASRQILNASMAPSRINDAGVGTRSYARYWRVC
ncbi:peptidase inhibitor family I36 protein [Streptosporangium canum]|uniref:peptidase inhibitor family I36 protein n=1 Tax=Streptosporangium canum TaxID=324952 RepID=UPI00342FB9A1